MNYKPACLVIAGPSGVGKTRVIEGALEKRSGWAFSISATTRPKRDVEEEGRDYYFLGETEFERRVLAGEFLEYASVYGNWYGTPTSELERAASEQRNLLIEVDTVGCLSIRALRPEIPLVAILPPDLEELKRRLRDRGTESDESLQRRFANIVAELQRMRGFDYAIINDDLSTAQDQLAEIMSISEHGLGRVKERVDRLLGPAGGLE